MTAKVIDCNLYFDRNLPEKNISTHYLDLILIINFTSIAITQKIYSQYNFLNSAS